MALVINEDTYVSANDVDEYINYGSLLTEDDQRINQWNDLSYEDQKTYLKTAAEEIDSLKYIGIKYDESQKMAFPRKYILHEDEEVPQNVKYAQVLEALELAFPSSDTDMAAAYSGNVRSYALGSLSESLKTADNCGVKSVIKSTRAQRLLQPYLGGGYRVR